MMDLHRLVLLRELAARGTVTAAAGSLGYTPSAVSQQLRTLEREVGVPLLERRGRRLVLTPAGDALVAGASEVLSAVERATSAAVAAAAVTAGPVHVGASASVATTVVPHALAELHRSHPELVVRLTRSQEDGRRELELGHLDVWIDQHYSALPSGPDRDEVDVRELLDEPVVLAVPTASDLGADLTAYADRFWVAGPPGSACRRLVDRLCQDAGVEPEIRFVTEDLEPTAHLVASGIALAVLPRLATTRLPDGVTVHPLPGVRRRVLALTRTASAGHPGIELTVDALSRAAEQHGHAPTA